MMLHEGDSARMPEVPGGAGKRKCRTGLALAFARAKTPGSALGRQRKRSACGRGGRLRENPVSSCRFKVKARLFTGFIGGEDLQKNVYLHFMCLASGGTRQGRFSEKKKNVMTEISKQRTLKGPVSLSGVGLHSGRMAHVTLKPAPEDSWFVFKRVDLPGQPEIRALAENVVDTARGTTLEENGARVVVINRKAMVFRSGCDLNPNRSLDRQNDIST